MFFEYKNHKVYLMQHGGGWSYKYYPAYQYGEFSIGFPSRDEAIQAAKEEIDGKRDKYGILRK